LMIKTTFPNCLNGFRIDANSLKMEIKSKPEHFIIMSVLYYFWSVWLGVGLYISLYPLVSLLIYKILLLSCIFIVIPYSIILLLTKYWLKR